jgi:hypothetical protein
LIQVADSKVGAFFGWKSDEANGVESCLNSLSVFRDGASFIFAIRGDVSNCFAPYCAAGTFESQNDPLRLYLTIFDVDCVSMPMKRTAINDYDCPGTRG